MSDENLNAQGQQAEAATPGSSGSGEVQGAGQNEGIQKRIDELVAKQRSAEEQVAQKDAMIAELIRAQIERPGVQTPPEPPVEVDPEERRRVEAVMTPYTKRLENMMARLEGQFVQKQMAEASAQVGDPRIAKRAEELMSQWRKGGYSGWVPEDAIKYAAGELALTERTKQANAAAAKNQFNSMGSSLLTGHGGQPNLAPPNDALPANFDQLSYDKQIEILEKRLGDKPF